MAEIGPGDGTGDAPNARMDRLLGLRSRVSGLRSRVSGLRCRVSGVRASWMAGCRGVHRGHTVSHCLVRFQRRAVVTFCKKAYLNIELHRERWIDATIWGLFRCGHCDCTDGVARTVLHADANCTACDAACAVHRCDRVLCSDNGKRYSGHCRRNGMRRAVGTPAVRVSGRPAAPIGSDHGGISRRTR